MATQETRFDPGAQILIPALADARNKLSPGRFGINLTLTRGQAVAQKTADLLMYPFNRDATDGTQNFGGFAHYAFKTDGNGIVYDVFGTTSAGATFYAPGSNYAEFYTGGVFDPRDVTTAPTGTIAAEVDTATPTNPTTGDIYTVENSSGVLATFTVGSTQTAAAVVTGLTLSWNANPNATAIATASGSTTFILTAKTAGISMNLSYGVSGTGTFPFVITTPATSALTAEVDTFTLAGTIVTGDIYTATITYPNLTTHTVAITVGATVTPTAVDALLIAAWNADPLAAQIAAASGTATFILTGATLGSSMNVAIASSGAGTISKVVTVPAFGRSIADVQVTRPGAYIMQPYGFWVV